MSRPPIMARTMAKRKLKTKPNAAHAVKTMAAVWQCSKCGTIMPLNDPTKPPKRCSNRETCGVMFFNGKEPGL